jgi:hypothetical protein
MTPATPNRRDAARITLMRIIAEDDSMRTRQWVLHDTIRTLIHSEPFDWEALQHAQSSLQAATDRRTGLAALKREIIASLNRGLELSHSARTEPPL